MRQPDTNHLLTIRRLDVEIFFEGPLAITQRWAAGAGELYWCVQFDAKALEGLAKANSKAHFVCRRTGQFRAREVIEHGVTKGDQRDGI